MKASTRRSLRVAVTFISILAALALAVPQAQALPLSNRIQFAGKQIYVNGTNVAWHNWARDVGAQSSGYDPVWFENFFTDMQANGVNVVRLWIHASGEYTPTFDASWNVTGFNPN